MVLGVLRVDVHVPESQSLKDKRAAIKSLKDRLRGRFNIAVAEVEANELWQRTSLGVAAVGSDRAYVQGLLQDVMEWLRTDRVVVVITIEEEYY